MIGQRIGNYEIVAALGQGGMGVVYRARAPRFPEAMAPWRKGWRETREVLEQARDRRELPDWLVAPLAENSRQIAEAEARLFGKSP